MIDEIWGDRTTTQQQTSTELEAAVAARRPRLIGPDQNPCCTKWTTDFLDTLRQKNVTLDAFTYHNYDGKKVDHAPGVLAKELTTPAFLQRHIAKGAEFREIVDKQRSVRRQHTTLCFSSD